MPVIFRQKGYAFFFVMFDLAEPVHVHVRNGRQEAKFWVQPISLAWNRGYRHHELNEIERIIRDHQASILATWESERNKL